MAFKEFDVNTISRMSIVGQFLIKDVPIKFLYDCRIDTLFVLKGEDLKYIGCFSGDNTFVITDTKEIIHVPISYKDGFSFEKNFIPTYASIITQLVIEGKI